jgi:hypothetical protein
MDDSIIAGLLVPILCLLVWAAFAFAVGNYASKQKGRARTDWFVLSLLISPLLAFLILALLPGRANGSDFKKCPSCAEVVRAEAKRCKHCQGELVTA